MKQLSKEEMKTVMGGYEAPVACDETSCAAKGDGVTKICWCGKGNGPLAGKCLCTS